VAKEIRRAQRGRRPIYPLLLAGDPLPAVADLHYVSVVGAVPPPARFVQTLRARVADPPPPASSGEARLVGRGFPLRNPHFVGRETLLHELAEGLLWSPVAVQALRGMGGVGKTQLAAELAPVLGLPAGADVTETAAQVVTALGRSDLSWLIIFDNAVNPQHLEPWLPRTRRLTGDVIITSRYTQWSRLGHSLDIDVMSQAEAVTLLRERVNGIEETIAVEIVEFLGRLPLAVDLAGGYLATNGTPAAQYLAMLRDAGDAIEAYLDESEEERLGYRHTIATVWEPTRAELAAASPAAEQLLRLCCFLAPEPIPLDLFTAHPNALPEPLASAAADAATFERTVGELLRRSLARRDADGLSIHRLLAATIRHRLSDTDRQEAAGVVRELLYQYLPAYERDEHLTAWPPLLPHVLAAVEHPGPSERTAWLLGQAGLHLKVHGQPAAAQPLLERALRIGEATFGPNPPTVATDLSNLATVLHALGQAAEARPLLERALRIAEASLGPDHPNTRIIRGNLEGLGGA
jgi:tetratricopeptide (TPR) repeat protein